MHKIVLIVIMLMMSQISHADELSIALGSKHLMDSGFLRNEEFNEFNPGISYHFSKPNIEVGTFLNSYDANTFYISRHWDTRFLRINYGIARYDNFDWDGGVAYIPLVHFSKDINIFRIGYIPALAGNDRGYLYGILTLQLTFDIN